jgi:subtilisin family serine protease
MKTPMKFLFAGLALIANPAFADISDMMWGLHNNGRPVTTYLNPLQSYQLQAVTGEDIHIAPPVQGRKVRVAVVDTGVDINQPVLRSFIFNNAAKCADYQKYMSCLDSKGESEVQSCRDEFLKAPKNVYPADCHGWNLLDIGISPTSNNILGRPDIDDTSGHGTHVAGIIASVSKNVEIIPVKVLGDGPNQPMKAFSVDLSPSEDVRNGYKTDNLSERVSRAIIYAMNAGAEVINLSIGWPENQNTDDIKDAIAEAQRRGIIIVAAAGNDSTNALLRPCQYKNVICVAAHSPDGSLASFSNFGFGVDIAAPGTEIVSTIPNNIRSARLPGITGYESLSGTSQATPFVAGVVADMLSRGIPSSDIYARLILGARAVREEKPLLMGPSNLTQQQVDASTKYKKTILSGLMDMRNSLQVAAQPLILPADKETQTINWDRKSANLKFSISLKNYWKAFAGQSVSVAVRPLVNSSVEPQVVSVNPESSLSAWAQGEEKSFTVNLRIKDQKDPSLSRLPSELSYMVQVSIGGKLHRSFEIKADVIVSVNEAMSGGDVFGYNLVGSIPRGMKLSLVDEVLDAQKAKRDYFLVGKDDKQKNHFNIALVRNTATTYNIERSQSINFDGDIDLSRPQYKVRLDMDGDGQSEYIFGVIEYLDKEKGIYGDYRNHFYIFDNQMNLKKYVIYDDNRAALPYTFYWMKVNGKMRPAWVTSGREVQKQVDLTDVWGTVGSPDDVVKAMKTPTDLHFYYLNEDFKLAQVDAPAADQRIVDVIQGSAADSMNGILTVLIAKNLGTQMKPSYLSEFSIAKVQNGLLSQQKNINNLGGPIEYRNLIDTFADRTMSLNSEASEFRGMMWYGLDAHQQQRVTMLDLERGEMTDKLISSQRRITDNALLIKSGFQSAQRKGIFLITNSELEYHDLKSDQVVSTSLNRYSFFGDANFVELYFPITLTDRLAPDQKLPALFTTEQSALSKGIRLLTPVYGADGRLEKMVSPARLRLKAETGCKPLEAPVYLGESQGFAMDYQCSTKIIRFLLKY